MGAIDRPTVIAAVRDELDARARQCSEEHALIGGAVADRLGLLEQRVAEVLQDGSAPAPGDTSSAAASDGSPARGEVWLFGRRVGWLPVAMAARFHGIILATRSGAAPKPNRSPGWCEAIRAEGVELAGWDWMLRPGQWKPGLAEHVSWLAGMGASALCLNIEPASGSERGTATDWRGKHDELRLYVETARELCERHGLQLWVTSWSLPSQAATFPWLELVAPAHRCIPQPYEVHGLAGPEYVARVLREWRERGAGDVIIGRGAHELDKSDADAWRTRTEILEHRASTPPGMDEAWWLAAGTPPAYLIDAILEPL